MKAKRLFDIIVAAAALLLLWPLMALVAVAIRFQMGSPILFRQARPGWKGRLFEILKFRTMREAYTPHGQALADAERLTALGGFLRSASLDELPQVWNVLRGDMSLVGPRPLLAEYLPRYTPRQSRRHEVRPGITGWSQVRGRNALTWEEKLELDVWYVDHQGLWTDLRVLAATLGQVLRRAGVSQPGHATMPEFLGTAEAGEQHV